LINFKKLFNLNFAIQAENLKRIKLINKLEKDKFSIQT